MMRGSEVGLLATGLLLVACSSDDPPTGPTTGPTTGSITVTVTTIGEDAPTGYTVALDESTTLSVDANGSVTFASVPNGSHQVGLTDVPTNCAMAGANPANVTVNSGAVTPIAMSVTCSEIVGPIEIAAQVSAEGMHTCGLKPDGSAYCWGNNSSGQLGNGSTTDSYVPVAIVNPGSVIWASITSGSNHSCGMSTFGVAYCWGDNSKGQLGTGSTTDSYVPVAVSNPGSDPWAAITAGYFHTCGVTAGGDAYCWGENRYGGLGNGSLSDSSIPLAVTTPVSVDWGSIAVGQYHTCGVTTSGEAYCWGENIYSEGALGDGSSSNSSVPVAVASPGSVNWASIAAGRHHSCGVSTGGEAYCWGSNSDGQLGGFAGSRVPVAVTNPGSVTWAAVSAGAFGAHTCGTSTAGEVYCWGSNSVGQLGNGSTTDSYVPVAVTSPGSTWWASVEAGQAHTCGMTTVGDTFCWGYSEYGQLGDGRTANSSVPVRVLDPGSSPPPNSLPVSTIESPANGDSFSTSTPILFTGSAQDLEDGDLSGSSLVWTSSLDGEIATGAAFYRIGLTEGTHGITLTATDSEGAQGTTSISLSITSSPDADEGAWTHMSTGGRFACGLAASGEAWCWGAGGTLGNGLMSDSNIPVAVVNPGSVVWKSLTAGSQHGCGVTTAGEAYCWGDNFRGQLGDGSNTSRLVPVPVTDPGSLTWMSVAAGGSHTCGVTSAGEAYCWGDGSRGQLGTGDTGNSNVPVAVANPGSDPWIAITAGTWHSCGVTAAGDAYCWGENFSGKLGDGSWTDSSVPVAVSNPGSATWASVAAGLTHTCGVTSGGDLYCWGGNQWGQLGDGSFQNSSQPVAVASPGPGTWTSVAIHGHSCGLTTTGEAYCWGYNQNGELGDGSFWNRSVPVAVLNPGSVTWAGIAAGGSGACSATTGGAAYCWGLNDYGQLGDGSTADSRVPVKVLNP